MADTTTPTKRTSSAGTFGKVWTDEERAAMQESARERKVAGRRDPAAERAEGEAEVRANIAETPEHDRSMPQRLNALVTDAAPSRVPRTYYGMPAYAKDGKVICFFQA